MICDERTTIVRATFPSLSLCSGSRLGRIACEAGAPSESPIPIKKVISANTHIGVPGLARKTNEKTSDARNKSAPIMTRMRGNRSAITPLIGEKRTAERTRAPKIKPSDVALFPLLSKTVTASATGKAPEPKTKIELENQERRNPLYDQRDPASNSFTLIH